MRYALSVVAMLLSMLPVFAQTEYWSTVPAPKTAPAVYQTGFAQNSDYTWKYPYQRPTPAGVIRVRNAIVDSDGGIGEWSEFAELTVKSGWRLWGGSWNQPVVEDASGIAWQLEIVSIEAKDDWEYNPYKPGRIAYLYTGWGGSYYKNTLAPTSSHSPYLEQLTEDAWSSYTVERFGKKGRYATVSKPPIVVAASIPNKTYQLAYCRKAETGETDLSPPYTYTPSPLPDGTFPAEASWIRCVIHEYHPQGTLGLHFYRREMLKPASGTDPPIWGEWRRLPDAECYGTPDKPDDWLWPIWKRQCLMLRYVDNAPVHTPVANPQSRLTKLHRLLRGDPVKDRDVLLDYFRLPDTYELKTTPVPPKDGVAQPPIVELVVVKNYNPTHVKIDANGQPQIIRTLYGDVVLKAGEKFVVHCPVIDEWGNGDSGTTGGVGDQKFERNIRAGNGDAWYIEQAPSLEGQVSWPVLLIHNHKSQWSVAKITAKGGDALAYSDYSGGQCFGNRFYKCSFEAPMLGSRVTCGIRIDHDCAPSHHPSEQFYQFCSASGGIGVMFGGNQSANLRAEEMYANSNAPDPRGSVFYINNPNPIRWFNGLFVDSYIRSQMLLTGQRGVIFRCSGYGADLDINDIWNDAGFVRFIESNGVPVALKMNGGKLNTRGVRPVLGLFAGTTIHNIKSTWAISGTRVQPDPGTQPCVVINHNYRTFEPLFSGRTGLSDMVLKEPSEATALAMLQRFAPTGQLSPMPETGYRMTIDVPVQVTRERTPAEIEIAFEPYKKIRNLPAWGKTFIKEYYLKYVTETKTTPVTTIFNDQFTGKRVATEDVILK